MNHLVHGFAGDLRLAASRGTSTTIAPCRAAFATLGSFNPKGAATKLLAVQLFDHGISHLGVIDVGKAEARQLPVSRSNTDLNELSLCS